MKTMTYSISKTPNKVTISAVDGQRVRTIELERKVYEVLESCTTPTANGDLQVLLAKAMGLSAPGGRNSKAASMLERYTFGYRAFNGVCALLVGSTVGNRRFYQFNSDFAPKEDALATMLTKQGRLITDEPASDPYANEDLDIPEGYEPSAEHMNEIIDQAYTLLGYDPKDPPEEAPDLTYAEAVKILKEHE